MAVKTYSCFNCGAELKWDPVAGSFKCAYCDSEFQESDFKDVASGQESERLEKKVEVENTVSVDENTGEEVVSYRCAYCGAEVITNTDTAATFCVYCRRPIVLENNLSGEFKPTQLIPFSKTKEDAENTFKEFIKGKRFLPDSYIEDQNIEKITGVYVPFWLFDSKIEFKTKRTGKKIHTYSRGDYRYVKTDTYDLIREGELNLNGVPADASSRIDDFVMAAIEPFDYSQLKEFSTPYLSGFLAQRYDVLPEECYEKCVSKKIEDTLDSKVEQTCSSFSSVSSSPINKLILEQSAKYTLLPVWLLYSQFEGESYVFAMNGQSGKLKGNLPVDKKKVKKYQFKTFLLSSGIIGAVASAVVLFGGIL